MRPPATPPAPASGAPGPDDPGGRTAGSGGPVPRPSLAAPAGSDVAGLAVFSFVLQGLEVVARVSPQADGVVGGDFYDIIRLGDRGEPDGSWAVVIGEVPGRGAEAASASAFARATLRDGALEHLTPAGVLGSLNELLLAGARQRDEALDPSLCTAVVAVVEPAGDGRGPGGRSARVTLAVGGHPAPLVLRRHGGVEVVASAGILLGVRHDTLVGDQSLVLGPGDALVLYTDGVTAGPVNGEAFDEEELVAVLSRCAGFTAGVLAEHVETAARAFVEDAPRDDLAIVGVRVPETMGTASVVSADLPSDASAPGRARRIVAASLAGRGLEELVEPAVLLTSEVVTNAVVHGGGHARIGVQHDLDGVRVSVSDASDHPPRRLELGVDATSGRGVQLLDELADRWGVETHKPRGKTVWFELAVHRA